MINSTKVSVFALGGLEEIGKNTYGVQCGEEIILIDAGIKFPDDELFGIDYVIPDYTFLEQNQEKIKGLFITHGHEDHIGGIPYLLKRINVPIYAGKLALEFIKSRLEEHNLLRDAELIEISEEDTIQFENTAISFFLTTHSIPDAYGISVKTPHGNVVHTGDFKFDLTPLGQAANITKMAQIGKEGVLFLLSDSTNSEIPAFSLSERTVSANIQDVFFKAKGRIIFATFASNIYRIQQAVESSVSTNRKIAVFGRSMERSIRIGQELGYIKAPNGTFIHSHEMDNYPPEKVTVLCTGSQGEPMAALSRIAEGRHRSLEIQKNDMVIFSSSPIPGNKRSVYRLIDKLSAKGAEIIHNKISDIHTSGHGSQTEQMLMLHLMKPKYFVPIHGEYRMLKMHTKLAMDCNIPEKNCFILENGQILTFNGDSAQVSGKFPAGPVYVDGSGIGDIGHIVLNDRKKLSQDGILIATITINRRERRMINEPMILTRGFVYVRESGELIVTSKKLVEQCVNDLLDRGITNWSEIKNQIIQTLAPQLYEQTERRPMIIPIIMEVRS